MRRKAEEKIEMTPVPGIPAVKVVAGTGIISDFAKHIHSSLCVGAVTSGARILSIGGNRETVRAGDIFVINPDEPHVCLGDAPHSYTVLVIGKEIVSGIAEGRGPVVFRNFIPADGGLFRRLMELADALLHSDMLLEKESMLYSFIGMLLMYHSGEAGAVRSAGANPAIKEVRTYIDANCAAQITLDDLSRLFGLSPFHLNRLFCAEVGIAPHTYQLHRRIEKSKALLLSGMSIADVSLETGFSDQSHFTRFFRRIIGTSPGNFISCNSRKI